MTEQLLGRADMHNCGILSAAANHGLDPLIPEQAAQIAAIRCVERPRPVCGTGPRDTPRVTATRRDQLVGNRLALVGTVLYFMEWIGIAALGASLPTDRLGDRPAETVADYAHHPARTALLAGWLSFVLLGGSVFTIGLRDAFRDRRRELPLATFAVAAMTVSVAIEVISYALVASGAWLAKAHGSAGAIVASTRRGPCCSR